MASASDYVDDEEEKEQRIKFRRFLEDQNCGWGPEDLNIKWGTFATSIVEQMFIGWCMLIKAGLTPVNGRTLGYVKTQTDALGEPYVTSFSAVPMEGHVPVRRAY